MLPINSAARLRVWRVSGVTCWPEGAARLGAQCRSGRQAGPFTYPWRN